MSSLRASLLTFVLIASGGLVRAEEVVIYAGGETGRGFTLSAGIECLVVTAKHVIEREGRRSAVIRVEGSQNQSSEARVVRLHPDADLALLSLETPSAVQCADQTFTALPGGLQAVTRLESGIVKFFDVTLEGENSPEIFLRSDIEVTKGFSGTSLYLNGDRIGLMYGLDQRNGMIRAYTLNYILTALNIGQLRPMDVGEAQASLDRAIQRRDGSQQGQNMAISTLILQGYTFKGSDLSGVNLDEAVLANGEIIDARLHFTSLRASNGTGLDLSGSGLRFAYLNGANLAQADLSGVFAPMLDARNLRAPNATLARGNFVLADFRDADLRGADLSYAAFAFADLTGADLRGANLEGTYFIGATLVNAMLDDAVLDETNLLGTVLPASVLTEAQLAAACRHDASFHNGFDIRLHERWPSDRFSSGYEFKDLMEYVRTPWIGPMEDDSLRICDSAGDKAVSFRATYPASISMHLDREYLGRGSSRRAEAKERTIAAIERIAAAREVSEIFTGTGAHLSEWIAAMQAAASAPEATGISFASNELIHLHLIRQGILDLDEDLLKALYESRHRFERRIDAELQGAIAAHSAWPRFFPEKAPLDDIPAEGFEAYRAWTEARLATLEERITIRLPGCVREDGSGGWLFSTATGYLAKTPEGAYFPGRESWPRSSWAGAIAKVAGGSDKVVGAPVRALGPRGAHPIMFGFPEAYGSYVLPVSPEAAAAVGECTTETQLDLQVTGATTAEKAGTTALLFVEPLELRIYNKEGKLIAFGPLTSKS